MHGPLFIKDVSNPSSSHFFYSYPPMPTTTGTYNDTLWEISQNYTLCETAERYYNITSYDQAMDSDVEAWQNEYLRVCLYDGTTPLPTVPFNTSIPYSTPEPSRTAMVSSTPLRSATAGATSTVTQTSSTLSN